MPLVQLDFPNPLNTSVQVGDFAYFSNPIDYGTTGNPLSGDQWASTTTPHLTSDQSDIIMIGEIITIIPWDDTVSSIICDMPPVLFNQYFSNLIPRTCVQVPSGNSTCTGNCCNFDESYSLNVAVPQTSPGVGGNEFFWNNPTLSMGLNALGGPNCYMTHKAVTSTPANTSNWCLLDSSHPNYVPGKINYWFRHNPLYWTDENGTDFGPFLTVNDLINYLMGVYPSVGFYLGIGFTDFIVTAHLIPQFAGMPYWGAVWGLTGQGGAPITGTYSRGTYVETCTQGSFIMFSKDNKVNLSSGLGYYASATLRNDSPDKAELFNIGADIFESSK